jgi:integrase
VAHVQRKCASCRRSILAGARVCPSCGSREASWIARYRGPDHVERSRTFARKIDAERYLNSQENAMNTGEWTDPERANISLEAFWALQRTRPGKRGQPAASTLAKWDTIWDRYLREPLGAYPLSAITRQDVRDVVNGVESPWQGAETLKFLRMILYRAIDDNERIKSNPAARVEAPRTKRQKVRVLKPEEIAAVVGKLPEQWRAFVLLAAYGSLRWSELVAIKRDDLDLSWSPVPNTNPVEHTGRTVRIDEACIELNGHFEWGPTKTAGSDRTVALPGLVVSALAAHLLRFPPTDDGLVFYGETKGPIRRKTFRPIWIKALKDAEIAEHVRVGWLRHSGASLAYDATKDILATAQRLGHTSTRMVDSTYVEVYAEVSRQVADAIDERATRDEVVSAAGPARDQRGTKGSRKALRTAE